MARDQPSPKNQGQYPLKQLLIGRDQPGSKTKANTHQNKPQQAGIFELENQGQ